MCAPEQHHEQSHARPGRAATLSAAGLPPDTVAALKILRHVFQSFADPPSHGWVRAFETARACFPATHASEIGVAALAVVHHLARARRSGFVFCNPDCAQCAPELADDEYQLVSLLDALRKGDRPRERTHALLLCEGRDATDTVAATRDLARLLDAAQGPAPTGDATHPA